MDKAKASIKRLALQTGIFSAISRLHGPQIVILRYHSILHNPAEHADSIGSGIIHPSAVFGQQMEYVSRTCHPVTMDEVFEFSQGTKNVPPRSVAVTFDDGFEDNLSVAVPILNRCGVPATIYVIAGYVESIPWYCSLRYIFARTQRQSFVDPFSGTMKDLSTPKIRYESFLACSRVCASRPHSEIDEVIAMLEKKLDVEYKPDQPIMLSWDGIRKIIQHGHMIGSHSLSHPNMAYISPEELQVQMSTSRGILEEQVGNKIRHFSYPSPIMEPHWNESTVEVCTTAGYETAVTCTGGAVHSADRPLSLKRIFVPDTLDDFTWALENMFAGRKV